MKNREEIKQLGSKYSTTHEDVSDKLSEYLVSACFQDGYIQCQEDMADNMRDLLAWYMVNKGEQYRNETLFVDAVKDYMNLNKQD